MNSNLWAGRFTYQSPAFQSYGQERSGAAPQPILINDPIFYGLQVPGGTAFLSDVVNLINRSPTLVAEIHAADSGANGKPPTITFVTGNGGATSPLSPSIGITAPTNFNDASYVTSGASLNGGSPENITPAGQFVGVLAHEIAHWNDLALANVFKSLSSYTIEQAQGAELASEGKAAYNQYLVVSEIQKSTAPLPTGLLSGNILFQIQGASQDTQSLAQLQGLIAANPSNAYSIGVSYLGSLFPNVALNGGTTTYENYVWQAYLALGARNDLGLIPNTITSESITVNSAGVLTGCKIVFTGSTGPMTYSNACASPGTQLATLTNSSGVVVGSIGSSIPGPDAPEVLSVAGSGLALTLPGNSNVTLTATSSSLTLAASDTLNDLASGNVVTAIFDTVNLAASVVAEVIGSNNTVNIGLSGATNPSSPGTDSLTGSNLTINDFVSSLIFYSGTGGIFAGQTSDTIGLGLNSSLMLKSGGGTFQLDASGITLGIAPGGNPSGAVIDLYAANETVTTSNATIVIASNGTLSAGTVGTDNVTGNNLAISAYAADTLFYTGANGTFTGLTSDLIALSAGSALTVKSTGGTFDLNAASISLTGVSNAATINVFGVNENVTASNSTIILASNGTLSTGYNNLSGNNLNITDYVSDLIYYSGSGGTFTGQSSDTVALAANSGLTVHNSGGTFDVNATGVSLIDTASGATIGIFATGASITASNATIYLAAGTNSTIQGINETIGFAGTATGAKATINNSAAGTSSVISYVGAGGNFGLLSAETIYSQPNAQGSIIGTGVVLNDGTRQTVYEDKSGSVTFVATNYADGTSSTVSFGKSSVFPYYPTSTTNNYSTSGQLVESTLAYTEKNNGFYTNEGHQVTFYDVSGTHSWASVTEFFGNVDAPPHQNGSNNNDLVSVTVHNHDGTTLTAGLADPFNPTGEYYTMTFKTAGETIKIQNGVVVPYSGNIFAAGDNSVISGDLPTIAFLGGSAGALQFNPSALSVGSNDPQDYKTGFYQSVNGIAGSILSSLAQVASLHSSALNLSNFDLFVSVSVGTATSIGYYNWNGSPAVYVPSSPNLIDPINFVTPSAPPLGYVLQAPGSNGSSDLMLPGHWGF